MRLVVCTLMVSVIAVAGCGSKSAKQAVSSPQSQRNEAAVQKIVTGCLAKGNVATKKGRAGIAKCIAPRGHSAALQKCIGTAAGRGVVTKAQRRRLVQASTGCAEKDR